MPRALNSLLLKKDAHLLFPSYFTCTLHAQCAPLIPFQLRYLCPSLILAETYVNKTYITKTLKIIFKKKISEPVCLQAKLHTCEFYVYAEPLPFLYEKDNNPAPASPRLASLSPARHLAVPRAAGGRCGAGPARTDGPRERHRPGGRGQAGIYAKPFPRCELAPPSTRLEAGATAHARKRPSVRGIRRLFCSAFGKGGAAAWVSAA